MAILDSQKVSIGMSDFLMGSQDYIIVIIDCRVGGLFISKSFKDSYMFVVQYLFF